MFGGDERVVVGDVGDEVVDFGFGVGFFGEFDDISDFSGSYNG